METKVLLLQVDYFESANSKRWFVKKWYSNDILYMYRFFKEQDYLDFINPLLHDDVVFIFHRYNIDDFNKYFSDALELDFDL